MPAPMRYQATVVVPFRRERELLAAQLAALDRLTGVDAFEVILSGAGPDPATARLAEDWVSSRDHARLAVCEHPLLPGAARNRGAAIARAGLLAFCDADDEVAPSWLAEHLATFAAQRVDAAAGPLDEDALNPPHVRRWRTPTLRDGLPHGWWFLPYASAANLVVRRAAFEAVGGFAPDLPACEDVDLCWRLIRSGHELAFSPRATVRYRHRPQLRASVKQAFGWGRSSVDLVRRYRDADPPPKLPRPRESVRWIASDLRSVRDCGLGRTVRDSGYLLGVATGAVARRPARSSRAGRRRPPASA